MNDVVVLGLLYLAAMLILTLEVFLPSHGVLTVVGVGFLIAAIYKTFAYGQTAGVLAIVGSLIFLPTFIVISVKIWPNTWIGKRVIPPNPTYVKSDFGSNVDALQQYVGASGTSLTALRPVGKCEIDGRRIECVCESGMIPAGAAVQVVGVRGKSLEVSAAGDATVST